MRLIDADKLLKGHQDHERISTHLIYNAPTVDAEIVRHGHWTVDKWSDDVTMRTEFTCSACGVQFVAAGDANISVFEYCPHCGRKMDEEADDE